MYILCICFVYFTYILRIFYVIRKIMFVPRTIFFQTITSLTKSSTVRSPGLDFLFAVALTWPTSGACLPLVRFKTMCLGPLRLTPCLRNPVNSKIPCLGEASTKSPENY